MADTTYRHGNPVMVDYTPSGGQKIMLPEKEGDTSKWKDFIEVGPDDEATTGPAGHLGEYLEGAFASTVVGQAEGDVGRNYPH